MLPECEKTDRACIAEYILKKAQRTGNPAERSLGVAKKESGLKHDVIGDMDIICPRGVNEGKPVRARGIWQITECYYPQVSDEVAFDPILSTDFVMDNGLLKDGVCQSQFTTCK